MERSATSAGKDEEEVRRHQRRSRLKKRLKSLTVLINWLEWKKTGGALALLGIAITLIVWYWPRPAPGGAPLIPANGGESPSRYLHGNPSVRISGTSVILFGRRTASKYGPVATVEFGYTAYCDNRHVILHRKGVYGCIMAFQQSRAIEEPCFGINPTQVICELTAGVLATLNVKSPSRVEEYNSSLSAAAHIYPWRLKLADGLNCTWNWLQIRGHFHGGWICGKTGAGITVSPGQNKHVSETTNFDFNSSLIRDYDELYYAEDLIPSEEHTWSVLVETPNHIGVFQRVPVLQAWF